MKKEYLKYTAVYLLLAFEAEATKVDVDMSFYGPERCGLKGIQTLRFPRMEEDLRRSSIQLDEDMPPIELSALKFQPDSEFILKHWKHPDQFLSETDNKKVKERISALATTLVTASSFQRTIPTLRHYGLIPPETNFNTLSLTVTPHDNQCLDKNASYTRTGKRGGEGVLKFCSGGFKTVRLFDVVAHETGHGLFDALNPEYYTTFTDGSLSKGESLNHPYRAVHEFFGDWAAVYASCDIAIVQGQENQVGDYLNGTGFCMAPGWDGPDTCLRAPTGYSSTRGCEAHDNSILLTELMVEGMRGTYREVRDSSSFYSTPLLRKPKMALQYFQRLLISAVAKPPSFTSLRGFSEVLQETQDDMSRTNIASVDDFSKSSLAVREEVQNLYYETAQANLTQLLESELGESMDRCEK